jgi:hypothetical protein
MEMELVCTLGCGWESRRHMRVVMVSAMQRKTWKGRKSLKGTQTWKGKEFSMERKTAMGKKSVKAMQT